MSLMVIEYFRTFPVFLLEHQSFMRIIYEYTQFWIYVEYVKYIKFYFSKEYYSNQSFKH